MNQSELIGGEIFYSNPKRVTIGEVVGSVISALAIVGVTALLIWVASITG